MVNTILALAAYAIFLLICDGVYKLIEWYDKKYGVDRPMPGDEGYANYNPHEPE